MSFSEHSPALRMLPETIMDSTVLDDVVGSITFVTVYPDSFMSVTGSQSEPALICEGNMVPVGGLESSGVLEHFCSCC